jgi:hypothetical protein
MIQVRGSWIVIDGLCFHDGVLARRQLTPNAFQKGDLDPAPRTIAAVFIASTATRVIVRNCETINCPVAVRSYGEYALITKNHFHD